MSSEGPSIAGGELLRRLGGVTRGVAPSIGATAGAEGASFDALLERARAGRVETGREIRIGEGVTVALNDAQMRRVSAAVDAAEASGAIRALVMLDGQALTVDVASRTIVARSDGVGAGVITGVDAVVTTGERGDGAGESVSAPISLGRLPAHPGLMEALGA